MHKRTFIVSGKRSLLAERGADLRVPAPGQAKKVAMMGSLDRVTRRLIVHTSRTKRSADFIAHLEQLDRLFGPKPGRVTTPVVLVEDNGPIHVSKIALAALDARKHWLTVEWLPKYSPELNDIEVVWRDLKAHHLAYQTFTDAEALDREIHAAVEAHIIAWSLCEGRIRAMASLFFIPFKNQAQKETPWWLTPQLSMRLRISA